jgi:zona occludens toxin
MITLITGAPGTGKTALAVSMMEDELNGRPLYVDGVKDLCVPHEPVPEVDSWVERGVSAESGAEVVKWTAFPPNAVIVLDECQRLFRPRPVGSKVPDAVAGFETHRHAGLDFWLITQHPNLLDSNVRRLVGRHIHIRHTALGRYLYEWTEVGDPESKSSRDVSASRKYQLPKKVFNKYKSAELHTKSRQRMPLYVYVLGAAVLGMIGSGLYIYRTIEAKITPEAMPVAPGQKPDKTSAPSKPSPLSPAGYVEAHKPRIADLAFSAPVYDEVTKPVTAPIPAACVQSAKGCKCWSQQATTLQVSEGTCRSIVAGGFFLAFEAERNKPMERSPEPSKSSQEPLTVLAESSAPSVGLIAAPAPITLSESPKKP